MRTMLAIIGLSALCLSNGGLSNGGLSNAVAAEPGYKLRVDLIDGSRIVGTPSNTSLKIDVGFDELEIPLERIRRARKIEKPGTIRLELTNRDTLSGKLIPEPLKMKTIFGPVELKMDQVIAIEVVPVDTVGWLPTHLGLVAYYAFDDGANATNRGADKHHGKVTGVKWLPTGRRGGAFEFDGKARLTIDHHEELCPQQLTLAAWICPHGETTSYQFVMGKTNSGSWSQGYGLVRKSGDGKHLHFFVNFYSSSSVKAEIPADTWSHVALVFDGKRLTFYLNGKPVDSKTIQPPSGPKGPAIKHTATPLMFGGDGSSYNWNGKLDEFVLYNRPLAAEDIQRLYETALPVNGK